MCECKSCVAKTKAKEAIDHNCDGPITPFVLISRAIELAHKRKFEVEAIANALHESLDEYGWIKSQDNNLVETDS